MRSWRRVAQRLDYDSFGRVIRDTNPGFQPFGFQGGLYDPDTGLVEFGCRWYDAQTGRWISKDPILLDGGWNVYAFCDNDPVNRTDPSGLCEESSGIDSFQTFLDVAGIFDPTPASDGLKPINGVNSHGQKVFTDGKWFYTMDKDAHKGGAWKRSKDPNFKRRDGTFDRNLIRIGD